MLSRAGRLIFASAVVPPTLVLLSARAEATSAGARTTSSVLTAAKSDIGKQTSVHLVVTSSSRSTSVEEHIKADLGTVSGIETISEGSETVVLKVTPSYGYLSGDSSGLTKIFGMTSAQAKRVGKDWVSVKAGTSQYKDSGGLDNRFLSREHPPGGQGYEAVHGRAAGQEVVHPEMGHRRDQLGACVGQYADPLGCRRHATGPGDHDGFGNREGDIGLLQVGRASHGEHAARWVDYPLFQGLRLNALQAHRASSGNTPTSDEAPSPEIEPVQLRWQARATQSHFGGRSRPDDGSARPSSISPVPASLACRCG